MVLGVRGLQFEVCKEAQVHFLLKGIFYQWGNIEMWGS